MARDLSWIAPSGETVTYRIERKYSPGFPGESLLFLFRPDDGSRRFSILVVIPGSLVPRLGPEFDRLGASTWPFVLARLEKGDRRDLRILLREGADPEVEEAQGLRKYPMPGADGGEVGSWG